MQTWLVGMVYYGGSKSNGRHQQLMTVYFTPLYLQNVRGFGIIESAALLLPLVLSQVLTTVVSGYVIKWTGRARTSFLAGFVVWLAGQGAQLSFDRMTSVGVIIGCLALGGAAAFAQSSAPSTAATTGPTTQESIAGIAAIPAPAAPLPPGMTRIFDGQRLDGWRQIPPCVRQPGDASQAGNEPGTGRGEHRARRVQQGGDKKEIDLHSLSLHHSRQARFKRQPG